MDVAWGWGGGEMWWRRDVCKVILFWREMMIDVL